MPKNIWSYRDPADIARDFTEAEIVEAIETLKRAIEKIDTPEFRKLPLWESNQEWMERLDFALAIVRFRG